MYWRNGSLRNRASTVRATANCCALGPQKKTRSGEEAAPAAVARNAASTATAESTLAKTVTASVLPIVGTGGGCSRRVRRKSSARTPDASRSAGRLQGAPNKANAVIENDTRTAPAPPERIARLT